MDIYNTDGVTGDNEFIKAYPFSPYTGGCCPCPSHNPSASTTATRIFCSPRLKTWGDAAKTTQCTSAGRGDAVYVEGTQASTYIGGDKIIWGWSEDGEAHARTNIYTIFSLRMFGDLNFDDTIDAADYAAASSLTEHGWAMPAASNTLRKVELKTDLLIPGHLILSLTGDAQLRIWTTATPDTPLLVTGQSYTLCGPDNSRSYGAAIPENKWQVTSIEWASSTRNENRVSVNGIERECEQNSPVNLTELQMTLGAMRTTGIQTTDNMQGDIAEIILLRGDLSLAERNAIESYLARKYNLNEEPVITTEQFVLAPIGSNTVEITAVVTDDSMPHGSQLSTTLELVNESCRPVITPVDQSDQSDGLTRTRTLTWRVTAQFAGSCRLRLNASDDATECSSDIQVQFRELRAADLPQAGLKLWLRADSLAVTNNAPVTEWRNMADTASVLIQNSLQSAPRFKSAGANGLPSVSFDGADDWLQGSFDSHTMPVTVIVVGKYANEVQPDGDFECIYTIRDHNTPLTRMTMGRNLGNLGSPNCYAYWLIDDASPRLGPTLTGGVWQVFNTLHTTESPKHRLSINGYQQQVQDNTESLSHNGDIELGRLTTQLSGNHYFNGEIAEILVFDQPLSSNQLAQIETYLAARYRLHTGNFDRDGDGISDAAEDLLNGDIPFQPLYQLPFRERFELETIPATNTIDGLNGWHLLPDTTASTQTNIVSEGQRALHVRTDNTNVVRTGVVRPFANVTAPVVWIDLDLHWQPAAAPDSAYLRDNPSTIIFYVKSQNIITVFSGTPDQGGAWLDLACAPSTSQWRRVTAALDYSSHKWLLCVDGQLLTADRDFHANSDFLSHLQIAAQSGYVDNITVSETVPPGVSADGDSLEDLWELQTFGHLDFTGESDPDNDGLTIDEELALGTNSTNPDSDGDGLPDGWEVANGLDPLDPADAGQDLDGDGLTSLQELLHGSNPNDPDSDNDGLSDGLEVNVVGSNPLNRDSDNDGMSDGLEYSLGFSPTEENCFFRIDHNSGKTYWYTSFEADEGYQTGPINGVQAWQSSAECIAVINTDAAFGLQAVAIPPRADEDQPAEILKAHIGGDLRSLVWMTWYQKFTPGMPEQSLLNKDSTAIICFPTNSVAAYDGSLKEWKFSETPIPLQYNDFVRIDVKLDYTAKKYMVCVNGRAYLKDIIFANPDNSALSGFAIKGGSTQSSFILDDISISIDEPAELDFDGDGLFNSEERALGTDIWNADTDGDNISDYDEIHTFHTDPNRDDIDSDNDGLFNAEELLIGLNPAAYDSNGDGLPDHSALVIEAGSSAVETQGDWITAGTELVAETPTDHSLAYTFNITTAGVYRLALFVSDFADSAEQTRFLLSVDDAEPVDMPHVILPPYNCDLEHTHCSGQLDQTGTCSDSHQTHCHKYSKPLAVYTPWLKPGAHTLTLDWLPTPASQVRPAVHKFMLGRINAPDPLWYIKLAVIGDSGSALPGDADSDGLPDLWEATYGLPTDADNSKADSDNDGLTDLEELIHGFDPTDGLSDNDGDGLPDVEELHLFGTSPLLQDSDGNGIADGYIVTALNGSSAAYTHGAWTNLNTTLAALDVFTMRAEYVMPVEVAGMYRLAVDISNVHPAAAPGTRFRIQVLVDGIRIGWLDIDPAVYDPLHSSLTLPWLTARDHVIRLAWLDNYAPNKLLGINSVILQGVDGPDLDNNGIDDWQEWLLAQNIDTDGDGLSDGDEVLIYGTDPLKIDSDGDSLTDGHEQAVFLLDPLNPDTDGDGLPDSTVVCARLGIETAARHVTHITTDFTEVDNALVWAKSTASSCSYDLAVPAPGFYVLELDVGNHLHDLPDDYLFDFRVNLLERGIGQLKFAGDIDRLGTGRLITPWLTPGVHRFRIYWKNFAAKGSRVSRPALYGVRLVAVNGADTDGDGMQDWMKERLLTSNADTDGDGLKDRDEVLVYASSPVKADTDGDGLSDKDEVLLGTDLLNPDTDGDGLSDYDEILLGTDPLFADFPGCWTTVAACDGSEYTASAGKWHRDPTNALAFGRGWVEYTIDLSESGVCMLRVDAAHEWWDMSCSAAPPLDKSDFLLHVDEQFVGRFTLEAPVGSKGAFQALLPYLKSGSHRVRLFWNAVDVALNLRVHKITLGDLGGQDADGDGFVDWIRDSAMRNNGIDNALTTSFVSPACLEGFASYPGLATAVSGADPVAVLPGVAGRWYADLPLDEAGSATPLAVAFENGVWTSAVAVAWAPLNLLEVDEMVLRVGDTLMFTIQPPDGETNGLGVVSFTDAEPIEFTVGQRVIHSFDQAGHYVAQVAWLGDNGAAAGREVTFIVMAAPLPEANPACLLGRKRTWNCPGISAGVKLQSDSEVVLGWDGTNATFTVKRMYAEHFVVARAGADGPVLSSRRIDHFWVQAAVDAFLKVVEVNPSGQIWEARLVGLYIPESVTIELRIFVGGVIFDDLTLVKSLSSADIGEAGDYLFRMIRGNGVSTSTCHTIKAYQDGILIGEAYYSSIGLPEDLR